MLPLNFGIFSIDFEHWLIIFVNFHIIGMISSQFPICLRNISLLILTHYYFIVYNYLFVLFQSIVIYFAMCNYWKLNLFNSAKLVIHVWRHIIVELGCILGSVWKISVLLRWYLWRSQWVIPWIESKLWIFVILIYFLRHVISDILLWIFKT